MFRTPMRKPIIELALQKCSQLRQSIIGHWLRDRFSVFKNDLQDRNQHRDGDQRKKHHKDIKQHGQHDLLFVSAGILQYSEIILHEYFFPKLFGTKSIITRKATSFTDEAFHFFY